MRKIKNLLLGLVSAFSLSSCGLLGADEGLYIQDVIVENLDDGSKKVSIVFTDEDVPTVTFTIPKGDKGDQGPTGIGIASIETDEAEDGKGLVITVNYTDPTLKPSIWEIPNANSVESFSSSYDEETGLTTITFLTSDGEEHAFALPQGKDGVGIASVSKTTESNGDIVITITYTDPTVSPTEIRLPYKNGEDGKDGRGIESIVAVTDAYAGKYYLTITYTDDLENPVTLEFDMPEAGTRWFSGNQKPSFVDGAKEGDYYFDLTALVIYRYSNYVWREVASLGDEKPLLRVTFDAVTNGGVLLWNDVPYVDVQFGSAIPSLPLATKDGSVFLGWYSSSIGPKDPTSGKLTDLTPITRSMTVYACFEEIGS